MSKKVIYMKRLQFIDSFLEEEVPQLINDGFKYSFGLKEDGYHFNFIKYVNNLDENNSDLSKSKVISEIDYIIKPDNIIIRDRIQINSMEILIMVDYKDGIAFIVEAVDVEDNPKKATEIIKLIRKNEKIFQKVEIPFEFDKYLKII